MGAERADDPAARPLAAGRLLRLSRGALTVDVAPEAGGRLAQVAHAGQAWLVGADDGHPGAIAWGCYPMLPWAGRLRGGRFAFAGQQYRLPPTLGAHAIHGVGFVRPWRVEHAAAAQCLLSLALPSDGDWPFGGHAQHEIVLDGDGLRLRLVLRAGEQPMPLPVIGWHPWLRKPHHLDFQPQALYPRDDDGIATLPTVAPTAGPWDDCFVNHAPVVVERAGTQLRLCSDCDHWVVYDQPAHATCVEPQSGPPDAFNLRPHAWLAAGASVQARFAWRWR